MSKSGICKTCKKNIKCLECDRVAGVELDKESIIKIWSWTINDIESLFQPFYIGKVQGTGGCGPSNGYTIFLCCLMDIWGSIINHDFGGESTHKNVNTILVKLKKENNEMYLYTDQERDNLVKVLRHNLVHNYGLKHLKSYQTEEHLNIDVNRAGPVINKEKGRWHIDCMRLGEHFIKIIGEWVGEELKKR